MVQRKISPVLNLALLAALTTVAIPFAAVLPSPVARAQLSDAAAFPLPKTVPQGTAVRIDGANSMVAINQALKQKFEGKFAGTTVTTATSGIEPALKALLNGQLDLVAMGRPLTPEEKAQGLAAIPAVRDKIAILVGPNNPFKGSLTIHQFAKIFRGEITDWSEVGGPPGPIRLVDRPETSDTRQAFRDYPVFQSAPFQAVATATQVKDDTAAVIEQLGTDGISYATANQVKAVAAVHVLNMHQVLPDDPRYPFSQPLLYVYQGAKPSPAAQAFLGYTTAPEGQAAIAEARAAEAVAIAAAVPAPGAASPGAASPGAASPGATFTVAPSSTALLSPTASVAALPPATDASGTIGWLWGLLPLGAVGAWLLLKRKGAGADADLPAASPVAPLSPALPVGESPPAVLGAVDAIDLSPETVLEETSPSPMSITGPTVGTVSPGVGAALGGAALAAGAGAVALSGSLGHDDAIAAPTAAPPSPTPALPDPWDEVTAPELSTAAGIAATGIAATGIAAAITIPPEETTETTPPAGDTAVAAMNPMAVDTAIAADVAAIPLASSAVEVGSGDDFNLSGVAAAVGGVAAAGLGAMAVGALHQESQTDVEATKFATPTSPDENGPSKAFLADVDAGLPELPDGYGESQIMLLPRDPQWGYAYWDTPDDHKAELRRQGGQTLALRVYDVTDTAIQGQAPQNLQQYDCDELARDWYVPIPFSDRDYVAEIGYVTADGRWLMLARSQPVRIPPMFPSDWFDDHFLTIDWQADLRSRTFMQLMRGRTGGFNNPIYDHIFGLAKTADAQRVAGSMFGSMQHVAGSVPPGSAQMVGSSERLVGASEQMVGGSERLIGSSERLVGASEQMMGASERLIGSSEQLAARMIGGSELRIGGSERMMAGSESLSSFSLVPGAADFAGPTLSGVGMGMSGVGMSMSGVGMSGMGMNMSGVGFSIPAGAAIPPERLGPTMSGVGMSGVGMSGVGMSMSGVGMSGVGMSMSGVGMSGVGMSGVGMGMSGVGMSGVGMSMSGVGFAVPTMSGMGMSGIGFFSSMPPIRARKFWLLADAELIVYGATEPDATVFIGGQPIALNSDGTFRFHMPFPDGQVDFPVLAIAADGVQTRSIHMNFNRATPERRTNSKDEAIEESY